jgi:hypothetical protein
MLAHANAVHLQAIRGGDHSAAGQVLIIYTNPSTDVRRVRLHDSHSEPLTHLGTGIRSVITRAIRW